MNERDRFDKFTDRARRVFSFAQEEAQRFQVNYIGTEHLLLGLLREGEGIAAGVLESLGVRLEQARKETLKMLNSTNQESIQEPPPVPAEAPSLLVEHEPALACSFCGAQGPHYFQYCFNCGQKLV